MATDASTRLQGLDPGFWEQLARTVNDLKPEGEPGTTAEELKQDYIAEAQAFEDKGVEAPEVTKTLSGQADNREPWEIKVMAPLTLSRKAGGDRVLGSCPAEEAVQPHTRIHRRMRAYASTAGAPPPAVARGRSPSDRRPDHTRPRGGYQGPERTS
ncbi:hypothetical protein [Streptomyces syringium]|uniref:hypothetical protein n=1 Tax=Streptomyces syringium TaxID=76729 RepID=UPI0033B08148